VLRRIQPDGSFATFLHKSGYGAWGFLAFETALFRGFRKIATGVWIAIKDFRFVILGFMGGLLFGVVAIAIGIEGVILSNTAFRPRKIETRLNGPRRKLAKRRMESAKLS